MSKLVDMVIDNGGEPTEDMRALVMSKQTLIYTNEQVCAPLVKRINESIDVIEDVLEAQGRTSCMTEDLLIYNLKTEIADYRALIGDKE